MPVEEIIVHRDYKPNSKNQHNDIALIRLAKDIKFTYFIKPICLPINCMKSFATPGKKHTVSGWGLTDICMCLMNCIVDRCNQ